jgi:hypothetical protein
MFWAAVAAPRMSCYGMPDDAVSTYEWFPVNVPMTSLTCDFRISCVVGNIRLNDDSPAEWTRARESSLGPGKGLPVN